MHLQYYLNLVSILKYNGSGQIQLTGSAVTAYNVNKYLTLLKFKPYDTGYDINANQWKVLEIFGVNGKFQYKVCNGNTIKYFNEEDLFSETSIVQIYNNKIDLEINCLISKYQDIIT